MNRGACLSETVAILVKLPITSERFFFSSATVYEKKCTIIESSNLSYSY